MTIAIFRSDQDHEMPLRGGPTSIAISGHPLGAGASGPPDRGYPPKDTDVRGLSEGPASRYIDEPRDTAEWLRLGRFPMRRVEPRALGALS